MTTFRLTKDQVTEAGLEKYARVHKQESKPEARPVAFWPAEVQIVREQSGPCYYKSGKLFYLKSEVE